MVVSQAAAFILMFLMEGSAADPGMDYRYLVEITGIAGLLTMIPCFFLYRSDEDSRRYGKVIPSPPGMRLSVSDGALLLVMGAALSFYGNILINLLAQFIDTTEYSSMMEEVQMGKSLLVMVLWMGIAAPMAEEMVFRWLVYLRLRDYTGIFVSVLISSVFFGVYHGNLVQAIYASLLGAFFAFALEMTGSLWSCMLLHIGANVFSLLMEELAENMSLYGETIAGSVILLMMAFLLAGLIGGTVMLIRCGKSRGYRAV